MNKDESTTGSPRRLAGAIAISTVLLWFAQPPAAVWPLAMFALVPMLVVITWDGQISRRGYAVLWAVSAVYWLISLQGLRHAHPAMHFPWLALGCYLAVYHVLFIAVTRRMVLAGVPLIAAAPITWVAQECLRNYVITGISALMLGHTMADVPWMIQIADLFGTYGVSLVIVLVNVAVFSLLEVYRGRCEWRQAATAPLAAILVLAATAGYGVYRLGQPLGDVTATFALVQRDEHVEYGQPIEHEVAMFQNYARQSVDALRGSRRPVDVVVWPESMFSGGAPWMMAEPSAHVPPGSTMTKQELQAGVIEQREYFQQRAGFVLDALAAENASAGRPHLLVGCGVIDYRDEPHVYSGVVSILPEGTVNDWYGKTHLVMFGEYIPIAPSIPGLRSLVPPGMGLKQGPGARRFVIGGTSVAPNICIETAVERVTVNQLRELRRRDEMPSVIVTVTNDGWFDGSSVIDHHLRCGQLVAVACRRPLLSAANNGPTAWVDSRGVVVQRLPRGSEGAIIASPQRDTRASLYVMIGDWPARVCVVVCAIMWFRARRSDRQRKNAEASGPIEG